MLWYRVGLLTGKKNYNSHVPVHLKASIYCIMLASLQVGWFVGRVTQKQLSGFPSNLDGGWVSACNRPHYLLVQILLKGQIQLSFPLTLPTFSLIFVGASGNDAWILTEKNQPNVRCRCLCEKSLKCHQDLMSFIRSCGCFKMKSDTDLSSFSLD